MSKDLKTSESVPWQASRLSDSIGASLDWVSENFRGLGGSSTSENTFVVVEEPVKTRDIAEGRPSPSDCLECLFGLEGMAGALDKEIGGAVPDSETSQTRRNWERNDIALDSSVESIRKSGGERVKSGDVQRTRFVHSTPPEPFVIRRESSRVRVRRYSRIRRRAFGTFSSCVFS